MHFFFDIGNGDCLAFFYYFGQEPYRDENLPPLLDLGRHVALHVDTFEDLDGFQKLLDVVASDGEPTLDAPWARKAELIAARVLA